MKLENCKRVDLIRSFPLIDCTSRMNLMNHNLMEKIIIFLFEKNIYNKNYFSESVKHELERPSLLIVLQALLSGFVVHRLYAEQRELLLSILVFHVLLQRLFDQFPVEVWL